MRGPIISEVAPIRAALGRFANRVVKDAGKQQWKQQQYPVMLETALRQLIAVSPDLQTA